METGSRILIAAMLQHGVAFGMLLPVYTLFQSSSRLPVVYFFFLLLLLPWHFRGFLFLLLLSGWSLADDVAERPAD